MMEKRPNHDSAVGDEVVLLDLFIMLWERKLIIFITVVLFVSVGLGYAMLAPEVYSYKTVIEIGTTIKNIDSGDPVIIEEPASLLEKLKLSFIPITIHFFSETGESALVDPNISVSSPKDSRLLVLHSVASKSLAEDYFSLHQAVSKMVVDDHNAIIASSRRELAARVTEANIVLSDLKNKDLVRIEKNNLFDTVKNKKRELDQLKASQKLEILALESRIADEKAKLENLKDEAQFIDVRMKLSENERLLVERQLEEINIGLNEVKTGRKVAADGEVDSTRALSLMMVENQIEMQRTRMEKLETRLKIELKRTQGELSRDKKLNSRKLVVQAKVLKEAESALSMFMEDIQRNIAAAKEAIINAENAALKFDINHETLISQQLSVIESLEGREAILQNTKPLTMAMQSARRISPKRALIVSASGLVGVISGVFAVFFVSFVRHVKRRQLQINLEQD